MTPSDTAAKQALSDKSYWDSAWEKVTLPVVAAPDPVTRQERRIHEQVEAFLQEGSRTLIEIGGAPGGMTAYYAQQCGCEANVLEYSDVGCKKTRENFQLLNVDVTIYHRDFFGELSDMPQFDMVMSSGFVEHFEDLEDVFARHVRLLKPGGLLMITVPNFAGIYAPVLRRTAPEMLARHNLYAMDVRNWRPLVDQFKLEPLFVEYVGGFYPGALHRCEQRTPLNLAIRTFFKTLNSVVKRIKPLRTFDSPKWSQRLLGVYRKPATATGDVSEHSSSNSSR